MKKKQYLGFFFLSESSAVDAVFEVPSFHLHCWKHNYTDFLCHHVGNTNGMWQLLMQCSRVFHLQKILPRRRHLMQICCIDNTIQAEFACRFVFGHFTPRHHSNSLWINFCSRGTSLEVALPSISFLPFAWFSYCCLSRSWGSAYTLPSTV